jgi:hypothetical protein
MKFYRLLACCVLALLFVGCATKPQTPVAMSAEALAPGAGRIGVLVSVPEKVDTYFPGAGCLLCYAAANAMHGALNAYVPKLSRAEAVDIQQSVVKAIEKRKLQAVALPTDLKISDLPKMGAPDQSPYDFLTYRDRFNIDRLYVIQIGQLGVERNFASYVPTGDAKAVVRGTGYMVNLKTNALEWYQPINVLKAADGNWDEAPSFPGLTNAYYQAIELARDVAVQSLK